ncbi:18513_t:CDS:1, partial [Racocetra fulgida]
MSNIDLYNISSYNSESSDHDSANTSTSQTSNSIDSNRKLFVWNFMHEERNATGTVVVVCDECSQEYSIKLSTGVLAEHLNKKHNYNITLKPRRFLVQKPYGKDDNTCIEECESSILDFFVGDQISFNTAES